MKVAVVTDSGSNIYAEKSFMDGLFQVPLQISDNLTSYLEGEEVSTLEIYEMMKAGKTLKTSLPPLAKIEECFKEIIRQGYERILAVPICTGLSGTLNAMALAAEQCGISIDLIDCYSTASNQLYLAHTARKMLDENRDVQEVKECIEKAAEDSVTYIIPNDLNHLARGGRLTPLAAALGGLLKIKPVLKVAKDTLGRIDAFSKVRTMAKAQDVVIEALKNMGVDENYLICVADVLDEEENNRFAEKLRQAFPNAELFQTPLISTVGVHTGLGCVGMQAIRKIKQ